jgi:hypothetical protein
LATSANNQHQLPARAAATTATQINPGVDVDQKKKKTTKKYKRVHTKWAKSSFLGRLELAV